ncbi:flavin reductase [Ensifer soli]|uniref:flavin reductase n=1 Tax=Ciceribacter sp. sgz301302 TaxID=3342379 RepID=UPI0035B7CEB7
MYEADARREAMLESIDQERLAYREAMSRLAAHVQILTASTGSERRGLTVTAACSVSDTPPTLLVCINAANPRNGLFEQSGAFALNLLGPGDEALADAFAGRGGLDHDDRFARADWTTLVTGAPILAHAVVAFDCRLVEARTVASHRILIGEVASILLGVEKQALTYFNRSYYALTGT